MSDENQAALDETSKFIIDGGDQATKETSEDTQTTESAPVEEVVEPEKNRVQERINKITADKHEERRQREASEKRANDLQKQLDDIESKKPTLSQPNLKDHEYDEESFNKANVAYQVQEQVKAELTNQKAQQEQLNQQAKQQQSLDTFNERTTALGKEDFNVKAQAIPDLPAGVADAIMNLDNGAEMVYHLGTHLDLADSLANMTPMAAMMELGKISSTMSVKKEFKTSAAPDPIETLKSGGSLTKERGPSGATYD